MDLDRRDSQQLPPSGGGRVARYELVRCVQRSPRAEAYEARSGGRRFRLELLSASDEEAVRALRSLATVDSEHVVRIVDQGFDEPSGRFFVVTPHWEGADLQDMLRTHAPFDAQAVVRLARQLAAGLEAIHACGIVHGRLTAASVLVPELEDCRLLARVGLSYATPEADLFHGDRSDREADFLALGAILHHACVGRALSPTDEPSDADKAAYPQVLREVVWRLRQVNSADRFRDDEELIETLSAIEVEGLDLFEDELARPAVGRGPSEEDADVPSGIPIGTMVGARYEVVKLLGRGGMGVVYEARDPSGGTMAIKLIRSESSRRDEDARRRFLREARAAGTIESEHVVSVFEAGDDSALGLPFIVMELLSGEDLGRVVGRLGPLEPDVAARIVVDATRGLAAAHRRGLVHRDIKPANIFLHELGDGTLRVKLCDFGIAKHTTPLADHASTQLTRSGGLLGSPLYMSPEHAQNAKDVDARSDVWSMCISLYEALTGASPWADCSTIGQVLLRLYTQDVPAVQRQAPWVESPLAQALHRGLEREPEQRYDSAEALIAALEPHARAGLLRPGDVRGVEPGRRQPTSAKAPVENGKPRRRIQLLAVVGVAAAIGALAWIAGGRDEPDAPVFPSVPEDRFAQAPASSPPASAASVHAPIPPEDTAIPDRPASSARPRRAATPSRPQDRSAPAGVSPATSASASPASASPAAPETSRSVPRIERQW